MEQESNKVGLYLGIAAFVILIVIGALVLAAKKPKTTSTTSSTAQNQSAPAVNSPQPTATDQAAPNETGPRSVMIQNSSFQPANLTIKKGTTVTWTNQDGIGHTVTSDAGAPAGGPNSSLLNQGQSYNFTFNSTGTFPYHCSVHPNMRGTVTVTQ